MDVRHHVAVKSSVSDTLQHRLVVRIPVLAFRLAEPVDGIVPVVELVAQALHVRIDLSEQGLLLGGAEEVVQHEHVAK